MSTPDPPKPDHRTQRQREEEKRRRRYPEPGRPGTPEIDPSRQDNEETEEEWIRPSR